MNNKSFKPIILKTTTGFNYFDYYEIIMLKADGHNSLCYTLENEIPIKILHNLAFIERKYCNESLYRCNKSFIINLTHVKKLEVKTRKLYLKNNLNVSLSEDCLKLFRRISLNKGNPNCSSLYINNNNDQIINKMKGYFFFKMITIPLRLIIHRFNKLFGKLIPLCITLAIIVLFYCCESNDIFYRPDLPEKLCCIGIIDIDGDTLYHSTMPDILDNKYNIRYISFEKSFQREHLSDLQDSLRNFSFVISTTVKDLFKYQHDKPLKNLLNFQLPDSLGFVSGSKYFLRAKERDTPQITAETTVPELPSSLNLISVRKELIPLSIPSEGWPLDIVDTLKSAEIKISFENNTTQKQYYALIIVGDFINATMNVSNYTGFLNFDIRETNLQGFFAEMQGLRVKNYPYINGFWHSQSAPTMAYLIDGNKVPWNRCYITLSTKFHGPYSVCFEEFYSIRIRLLAIPEELYLFEKSLSTYSRVKDDPFSEPVYLNGNIIGGNGVFAICRSSELNIDLSPPY